MSMKCVVFDVDGMLLGEEQYFNASALAVWEILYSRDYMGLPTEQDDFVSSRVSAGQIAYIRNRVWGEDGLLRWLYRHNAESMWDMSHLCMLGILWSMAREYKQRTGGADRLSFSIHKPEDFRALGMQVMGLHVPLAEQIVQLFKTVIPEQVMGNDIFDLLKKEMEKDITGDSSFIDRFSDFYRLQIEAFENWYLGDTLYVRQMHRLPYSGGKSGLLYRENSLVPAQEIREMMERLKQNGFQIGVATGRSRIETEIPFRALGWYDEFSPQHIATATDAEEASAALGGMRLYKPNPFLISCAAFGRNPARYGAYSRGTARPGPGDMVWVIGDSDVDLYGARAMGAKFIGVRTGFDSEGSTVNLFEREKVPCIDKVTNALSLILK